MKNVSYKVQDNKLHITVDLAKSFGPTKPKIDKETGAYRPTGNLLVASTGGNIDVGGGVKLGLNAYKPEDKSE